ncbi:MAG: hypothetical protein F6K00_31395 [Leptolyngbya sp. SIOISBB]|nr:hypothetical protein [Leptolyngbya sp. SIOISBB]
MIPDKLNALINGIREEEFLSNSVLHLTANENCLSKLASSFLSYSIGSRYALGKSSDRNAEGTWQFGRLTYRGMPSLHHLEEEANQIAYKLFNSTYADFRPLSGVHATICTISTLTKAGDLIFSLPPESGGHFASPQIIHSLGRRNSFLPWNKQKFDIDPDRLEILYRQENPSAILLDYNSPLFPLNLAQIRQIVGEHIPIIYDASHVAGLISGGRFQQPLNDGCTVLQANTHKSFPGPQKGMIHTVQPETAHQISSALSAGLISSQQTNNLIALYITLLEMHENAKAYAKNMILNSEVLAHNLDKQGFKLVNRQNKPSASHILLVEVDSQKKARQWAKKLIESGISVNARRLYGKAVLRLGIQEVTRRGMTTTEMAEIAILFRNAIFDKRSCEELQQEVEELMSHFPHVHYSFDNLTAN